MLAIFALVTNQIVAFRAYETKIRQLTTELEIQQVEDEYELERSRLGPGHPTAKRLSKKLEELRDTMNGNAGGSE